MTDVIDEAKFDPADFDLVATDKDKASAKMNIVMQLRKSMDVRGNLAIKFGDGKSQKVPMNIMKIALDKFAKVRKPDSKMKMQDAMGKSYKDMIMTLKTFKEETQMDEGFSPKEIKMAIGVASDKRYAGGNMTGAIKAIDKIKRGLSNHPQVSAVLRRQNEELEEALEEKKDSPKDFEKKVVQTMMIMKKYPANRGKSDAVLRKGAIKYLTQKPRGASDDLNESYGSMNASVDKVKVQKQIDQTEKHLKTFFGNTSSVKMKKLAMQKKLDKLKAQLKEEVLLDEALELVEAMGNWTISVVKPVNKLKKGQNVTVKARSAFEAINKAMKHWKDPALKAVPATHFKIVKEEVELELDEGKDLTYTVVHARKGKVVVTAPTSYAAAQKAAKQWKLKSTAGVDAHLMKEEVELDEISGAMQNRYLKKAVGQYKRANDKRHVSSFGSATQKGADANQKRYDKRHKGIGSVFKRNAKSTDISTKTSRAIASDPKRNSMTGKRAPYRNESIDLDEAPSYKLHHNTFSAAVQEAIAVAKKQGYDVDENDWSDKVATGPKKPSKDKTNRYSIKLLKGGKPTRKFLQIQVYNMGSKYELNCYVQ